MPMDKNTAAWDVEIAQAGRWNSASAGWTEITKDDLAGVVAAFNALKARVKPMLKLGHNDKQPLIAAEDGQPALGWISALKLAGNKLVATFTDVPDVLREAIRANRYKRVSVELDRNVKVAGETYPWVLSAVGLLGADIPAINTLADLQAYMAEATEADDHFVFTDFKNKEEAMEKDELQTKLTAATSEIATLTARAEKAEADLAQLKADVEKKEAEAAFTAAKDKFTAKCEDLVKAETMTPAQREKLTAQFNEQSAEMLIGVLDTFTASTAQQEQGKQEKQSEITDPGAEVAKRATNLSTKDGISFTAAQAQVLRDDPELAKAYRDSND